MASLTIDPAFAFGGPCIPGTRIPASAVAASVLGGDSAASVAKSYSISREQVLLCCWWQAKTALERPKTYRTAWEGQVAARWADWHLAAHKTLAGYSGARLVDDLPDPPQETGT